MKDNLKQQYDQLLKLYLENGSDQVLKQARQISKTWADEDHIGPEKVMTTHIDIMKKIIELPPLWEQSLEFLLQFMVHYGHAQKERELLIDSQHQIMEELSLAASLQQSLLPEIEKMEMPSEVDLGVVSVAAREVSGDFYNVYSHGKGIKFAAADVSGKSMPAAILMSMIKFAMDSLIEAYHHPHVALASLNRFICRHSDPSMFVTMFWGEYDAYKNRFYYSSAGHEPALFYKAKQKRFYNLSTDGCALGLSDRFSFTTKSTKLAPGDFILLYTDGVIENRDSHIIDSNKLLRKYLREMDLDQPAQSIVDQLHQRILVDRTRQVDDDQTLLLFSRTNAG